MISICLWFKTSGLINMGVPQFYNSWNIAEYDGDSYQNIIGDLIAVQSGYMISWIFFHFGIPWMSFVWLLVVEISTTLYMRDGIIVFFNVFFKIQSIINWQADGVTIAKGRQENGLSIFYPFNVFLKVQEETSEFIGVNCQSNITDSCI